MRILKHIVGLFAISLALTNCQGGGGEPTPENCGYYKTGTFKYVGSDDIRIERTDSLQIEYNLNGEGGYIYTDKFNVVWTITKVGRAGYTFTAVKGSHIFEGELKKTDS